MKHLETEERESIPAFDPAEVDVEFMPYLERINQKPFAATIECCIGHCPYDRPSMMPEASGGLWGYLQLLMTAPSAVWLFQQLQDREWLLMPLSKLWGGKGREMPSYTRHRNFIIAFAWDSNSWPVPAVEICSLLDRYHEAEPKEHPRYLNFPVDPIEMRKKRPAPKKRKKGR